MLAVGALLGAMLVLIAQFTALYHVHSATSSAALKTVGTGGNHAWAPIPLALAAVALAYAVYRHGNRAALAGLVALGVATLLIALFGDLPDAHSSGLIGSSAGGYVQATSSPSAGLYMETLGAVAADRRRWRRAADAGARDPTPGDQRSRGSLAPPSLSPQRANGRHPDTGPVELRP